MEMKTTVLKINGMTCQGCVASVTRVLKSVDGVSAAKVSLEENQARVDFDDSKVSVIALKNAIQDAGYEVTTE
jgi:copper chaperone